MGDEGLVWEEYEEALFNVFGRKKVEMALRILEGEAYLVDRTLHGDYHNMLAMYDRLESKKRAFFSL